jgi:hypothetical protein
MKTYLLKPLKKLDLSLKLILLTEFVFFIVLTGYILLPFLDSVNAGMGQNVTVSTLLQVGNA